MNNRFDEWAEFKKQIHAKKQKHFRLKAGQVVWVSVGQNIGSEVYGKGKNFLRPVVVINMFSEANQLRFYGVPLSSKIKKYKTRFNFIDTNNKEQSALLDQLRIFDNKRIIRLKSGIKIKSDDFKILLSKLGEILNIPANNAGS